MWSLASKRLKRTSSSEDFQRSAKRSFSTQSVKSCPDSPEMRLPL
jgi:hypothetical protein